MALPYYPSPAAITAFRRAPLVKATFAQMMEAGVVSELLGMDPKHALAYVLNMDRAEVVIRHSKEF